MKMSKGVLAWENSVAPKRLEYNTVHKACSEAKAIKMGLLKEKTIFMNQL